MERAFGMARTASGSTQEIGLTERRKRFLSLVHPLLIATSTALFLMAANRSESELVFMRALIFSLLGAGVMLLVVWLWLRDLARVALVTSLALLFISAFGHLNNVLVAWLGAPQGAVQAFPLVGMAGGWLAWVRWRYPHLMARCLPGAPATSVPPI